MNNFLAPAWFHRFILLICFVSQAYCDDLSKFQIELQRLKTNQVDAQKNIRALRILTDRNNEEIQDLKRENKLLRRQVGIQESVLRVLKTCSQCHMETSPRYKRSIGRDPLTEMNANFHHLQNEVTGIKLLEKKEFPEIKSNLDSHGSQINRMANLTNQLTQELQKLQEAARYRQDNEISIFYKPTELQKLHSEFSDLKRFVQKLSENQKWSEFLIEIDRKELQALKGEFTEIISDLSGSVESIENRTIHEPRRVLVTMLNDEEEDQFSGSGESPEPEEKQIGNWQIQVIEEIREIRKEQKREKEIQKKQKHHDKLAMKSLIESRIQKIQKSVTKIWTSLENIQSDKTSHSDLDAILKSVSRLKSDIFAIRGEKKTMEHRLSGKIVEVEDTIRNIRGDSKTAVFESQRALTIADVIKRVQRNHFTAIKNFKQDLNVMETDILKFGLKLTTLQAEFLNSSLFLHQTSEKDFSQDSQISRAGVRLEDNEKQIAILNSEMKDLSKMVTEKIGYSQWKNIERQLDFMSSKIGHLTRENRYFDGLAVLTDKRIENLETSLPHDCSMSNLNAHPKSFSTGIYILNPMGINLTLPAFCDMKASGGNWTLIQRRIDGATNFNRTWDEYAIGFGTVTSEFWLGNENVHLLTTRTSKGFGSMLRIDTWDIFGDYRFADYEDFTIGNRSEFFSLAIGAQIGGNLTDAMAYHAGMRFSAATLDLDASSTHCAKYYGAGWWYSHCHKANLNGNFHVGMVWYDNSTADWLHLKRTEMKIRPLFL